MRHYPLLFGLVMLLSMLLAGVARAHGSGDTADGPDAGGSIQVYVGPRLARHSEFLQGISGWNGIAGPRLVRVARPDGAEIRARVGNCTYLKEPFYGGTYKTFGGFGHLCVNPHNADGTLHEPDWYRRVSLHEFGHGYGIPHHFCNDAVSIMTVCDPLRVGHLTTHDRVYKRSLIK